MTKRVGMGSGSLVIPQRSPGNNIISILGPRRQVCNIVVLQIMTESGTSQTIWWVPLVDVVNLFQSV